MRLAPIFDTNVFGDFQRGLISQTDWAYLLSRRPARGWPLSSVTAFELLAGVDAASPKDFLDVRERIGRAYHLCNGRILEDPRFLIRKELLRLPPSDRLPSFAATASQYMDIIRRANSLKQLFDGSMLYKGQKVTLHTTKVLTDLMAGPKAAWKAAIEELADQKYLAWRELFKRTNRRLPPELRKELEPRSAWLAQRPTYIKALLVWLGANVSLEAIDELSVRLDAVLEFVIFVTREFLLRNYSLEKHESDIFDQFQLQHLAFDRFVIVSGDPDLTVRTRQSPQSARIMSFDQFLQTL